MQKIATLNVPTSMTIPETFRISVHDNRWNGAQDNYSIVGVDEGCMVGEVRAGTTSPDPKGFSYSRA